MAGISLLALLDDIVSVLDDVAYMSKVAVKKTAGVLGDDLALNAEQVSGVQAKRELPVVWAVAKGSFLNKCIIVPIALLLSAFFPFAITILLLIGGLYLCYEGFEKVFHAWSHRKNDNSIHLKQQHLAANADNGCDLVEFEQKKIKGAIRTDFILSAEIVVIALGSVASAPFLTQVLVIIALSIALTIGIYGLVAIIVKLDDLGLYLLKHAKNKPFSLAKIVGNGLLKFAPLLMKTLVIVGTAAMFLVGGGIIIHSIAALAELIATIELIMSKLPIIGNILHYIMPVILTAVVGILAGALLLIMMTLCLRLQEPSNKQE